MISNKTSASAIAAAVFALGTTAISNVAFAAEEKEPSAESKASCSGKEGCGGKKSTKGDHEKSAKKTPTPAEHKSTTKTE